METEKLGERVSRLEVITSTHETILEKQDKRIEKLEDNNEILHKMEVLLDLQVKQNERQTTQLDEFGKVLTKVNENLSQLNHSHLEMREDINVLDSKVEKVERKQEAEIEKYKLDLSGIPKKAILWLVGLGLACFTAWVMINLNLK